MNFDTVRAYCLSRVAAEEDFPFGPDLYVYKVKGKIFAILSSLRHESWLNLKCDPDQAHALRDMFSAVKPGYHMNKKHWNTVTLDGTVPKSELQRQIDHSWQQVVAKLPQTQQRALAVQASIQVHE